MGFYDCRCMLTGVSLKGSDAALVPLHGNGGALSPIACAVKGSYNRLGAIDTIEEDGNTRAILAFFLRKLASREFEMDGPYLRSHACYPLRDIEHLLTAFERNINDHAGAAVLFGHPVVFALICRHVWDSIAQAAASSTASASALLQRVDMYGDSLPAVSAHMQELSAVHDFLVCRNVAWQPPETLGQHYAEEMLEFLANGKKMFDDSPAVLKGLDRYEYAVAELLRG